MVSGLTRSNQGYPDYERALEQHKLYIAALEQCGLNVHILDADEEYPDSTFVEDVALLTPQCAIITRPAAASRRGETTSLRPVLEKLFPCIKQINPPGTLDGGDVMQIGSHFFIGLSSRTNQSGADQFISILTQFDLTGSTVPVTNFLHLKTGVTCVNDTTLLAAGKFMTQPEFSKFTIIPVPAEESDGANILWINDKILMSAGFPEIRKRLSAAERQVIEVDISEFAKIDGGLSCLSLRF